MRYGRGSGMLRTPHGILGTHDECCSNITTNFQKRVGGLVEVGPGAVGKRVRESDKARIARPVTVKVFVRFFR